MKYLQKFLLLLIGTSFFYSCSNEDFIEPIYTTNEHQNIETGSIQFSLNGDLLSYDNIRTIGNTSSLIQITASDITHGLTIGLSSRVRGIYTIGGDEENYLSFSSVDYSESGSVETVYTSEQMINASGTIEILETDLENNTISGIFDGTIVLDTDANTILTIENGLFNQVPY